MKSIDTNVVLHALDETSPYHRPCKVIVERMSTEAETWVITDHILFELYRALRNPNIFGVPLTAKQATDQICYLRANTKAHHICYHTDMWPEVINMAVTHSARKGLLIFDMLHAVTLKAHGVKTFYTRNVRDFQAFNCFDVIDPCAS